MPTYKLTSFSNRGRAEVTRQMLYLSSTPFEDIRIPMEEWTEFKKKTPFGCLPILEVNGQVIPQSQAIARYVAKEFGFAGKTSFESAWVDAIGDQFTDYMAEITPFCVVLYGFAEGDIEKMRKETAEPIRDKHFGLFEKQLKDNGNNGHLVGSSLTWMDLYLTDHMKILENFMPDFFEGFPALQKMKKHTSEIPKLKEWLEKRPQTDS